MSSESSSYKLHVAAKAGGIDTLQLDCQNQIKPTISNGEVVVQVMAAAVNPSDVKATLGIMPHAVFPRTPGRDFAGIVVEGPTALKGLKVWGSGGDIGGNTFEKLCWRKPSEVPPRAGAVCVLLYCSASFGVAVA